MRYRRGMAAVAVVIALGGCSSGGASKDQESPAADAGLSKAEVCQELNSERAPLVSARKADYREYAEELSELSSRASAEGVQVIAPLLAATGEMATASSQPEIVNGEVVVPYVEAEEALDEAVLRSRAGFLSMRTRQDHRTWAATNRPDTSGGSTMDLKPERIEYALGGPSVLAEWLALP